MVSFWIAAAVMALVAVAFVVVPLLRGRPAAGPTAVEANLAALRGQRREIEQDVAQGLLPADAREEALAELAARAEGDLAAAAPEAATSAPGAKKPWAVAAAAAVLVPAGAFALYFLLGTPSAADPKGVLAQRNADQEHVIAMVEQLASKVRERPDDVRGWSLLARSMAAIGRFDEAAKAYEHLVTIAPNDAQALVDYADALGVAQGRSLAGKPTELVERALAIDPKHHKALALAGTAAFDAKDYRTAVKYWERLAEDLPPGSEDETQVRTIIAEAREKGGMPAVASAPRAAAAKGASAPAAPGATVSGSVAIAPQLAAKMAPSDTLWVFARAENGPRAPLAVIRATAASLPMTFALDDSMSMSPQFKLSTTQAVRVEARVSRSGQAAAQPGDLLGTSAVVKPGARDVKIVIDQVVP